MDINNTGIIVAIIIISPPIVGVPDFFSSPSKPNFLIFSPICFFLKYAMILFPKTIEIINEIIHHQKKFVGIIIEFHKCGQNLDRISDFIKKIDLELSHIHANNNDDCDEKGVPETIEITFTRSPKRLGNFISLPDKLDRPNKKNRKEIILKFNN